MLYGNQITFDFIVDFLAKTKFLAQLDKPFLTTLAEGLKIIQLKGGEVLMRQDGVGDCLYFLMYGRLRVFVGYDTEQELMVGEIGIGEVVGEMALLTNEPRSATVIALRDCVLLRFDKSLFDHFITEHPIAAMEIAKRCISRLSAKQKSSSKTDRSSAKKTITFVPMSLDPRLETFFTELIEYLKNLGSVLHLTDTFIKNELGVELNQNDLSENYPANLIGWLNEQENNYRFIVYQANINNLNWSRLCKRQADSIYLIGFSNDKSFLDGTYKDLFLKKNEKHHARTTLVLLHSNKSKLPTQTKEWLNILPVDDYCHIIYQDDLSIAHLGRIISGRSNALVFSGGGARGLAHIGFIRAIEELHIPVDFIAGTSMGAIIGALFALGLDSKMMQSIAEDFGQKAYKMRLTFPYISLSSETRITNFLQKYFGVGTVIEDLWLRNFYISTNITQNKIFIHDRGLLWKAIRASSSLPVIYPPVITDDGLLVDGGIINNLPVDLMRQVCDPGKIIASTIMTGTNKLSFKEVENFPSIWQILWKGLSPNSSHKRMSYLTDIVTSSILLHGKIHKQLMEKSADFCVYHDISAFGIMDFKANKQIIAAGYESAIKQLADFSFY